MIRIRSVLGSGSKYVCVIFCFPFAWHWMTLKFILTFFVLHKFDCCYGKSDGGV